jgi:tetratricopeptide (TPR) repeat protein
MWQKARSLHPNHYLVARNMEFLSDWYMKEGLRLYGMAKPDSALQYMEKSVLCNERNHEAWYNLGGIRFSQGDRISALDCWKKTLALQPSHADASLWVKRLSPQ